MRELLQLGNLTEVVDVGANPIDGDPPYSSMLKAGLCRVTGFEPQSDALAKLEVRAGPNERYLNSVVGDGENHTLNVCVSSGLTSLLTPDPAVIALYSDLMMGSQILECIDVETRRLDDLIDHLDFLKIDVQGSELSVFRNGRERLSAAVAVHTEVAFRPIYKNQPSLGDIDLELRSLGFVLHHFPHAKRFKMEPATRAYENHEPSGQIVDGDAVYFRDLSRPDLMDDEQLKHLALIAHFAYHAYDEVLHCIGLLERRGALPTDTVVRYIQQDYTPLSVDI